MLSRSCSTQSGATSTSDELATVSLLRRIERKLTQFNRLRRTSLGVWFVGFNQEVIMSESNGMDRSAGSGKINMLRHLIETLETLAFPVTAVPDRESFVRDEDA